MVIMILLAVAVLAFLWGVFFEGESSRMAGIMVALMFSLSFLVLLYTGIESILIFNRDLRTKQSYMLWMLPKSIWEILGAKFISAVLQMFAVFVTFLAAACVCMSVILIRYGGIKKIYEAVRVTIERVLEIHIDWKNGILFVTALFTLWAVVIFTGFLAVIIARTIFLNARFSGVSATVIFFALVYVMEKGVELIRRIPPVSHVEALGGYYVIYIVYYLIICVILFIVSGWIADRKLSV